MLRLWHNHQYHSRFREKSLRRPGAVIRNCNKGSACRATACRAGVCKAGVCKAGVCRATVGRATARVAPTIHDGARGQGSGRSRWARGQGDIVIRGALAGRSLAGRAFAGRPQGSPLRYTERLALSCIVGAGLAPALSAPALSTPALSRKSYQLSPSYESEENSEHNGKY